MLTLYRRHEKARTVGGRQVEGRPHAADSYWKKCQCPMWVGGVHEGKPVKESLRTRSWVKALETTKSREGKPNQERITASQAVKKYYEDRRLSPKPKRERQSRMTDAAKSTESSVNASYAERNWRA